MAGQMSPCQLLWETHGLTECVYGAVMDEYKFVRVYIAMNTQHTFTKIGTVLIEIKERHDPEPTERDREIIAKQFINHSSMNFHAPMLLSDMANTTAPSEPIGA